MVANRTRLFTLLFIAVSSIASIAETRNQVQSACESNLTVPSRENVLRRRLEEVSITLLDGDTGIRVQSKNQSSDQTVRASLPDSFFNNKLVRTELWNHVSERFVFVNSGLKNLETHSRAVHETIIHHLMIRPGHDLELKFSPAYRRQVKTLWRWRWRLHDAVLDSYIKNKDYLTAADLQILKWVNIISHNSDVFAVLGPKLNLLATIQVSYIGDEDFLTPTWRGFLRAMKLESSLSQDRLPFEYRLQGPEGMRFRHNFYRELDHEQVCEFTRYAKFGSLPRPVQDRMLFQAIMSALRHDTRTIVAGGDAATTRLFARYGFKVYGPMPTGQSEMPEYLSYINVASPEFDKTLNSLRKSASTIDVQPSRSK